MHAQVITCAPSFLFFNLSVIVSYNWAKASPLDPPIIIFTFYLFALLLPERD